jgi:2-hydroxychromene-2-carboxylate isomerase
MSIEFWFDFHSPWAFLAATQIGSLANRHGLGVDWRPFHLPRLNATIGGRRPLEENAAFVAWYRQDLQDWATLYGETVRYRADFPLRPARALRAALYAIEAGAGEAYILAVFRAYWTINDDISDPAVLSRIARACGLDEGNVAEAAASDRYKAMLDTATQEAINAGLFGAPTMRWKGKLFFGNDRLALLDRFLGGDGRLVYARSAPG